MAENGTAMKVALVAALLAVVMIALALMPKQAPTPLTTADAERIVLEDARHNNQGAEFKILESLPVPGERWKVRLKVSFDAHTRCPKVFVSEYDLMPIRNRTEAVVKDCRVGTGPIVYEEEALIRSLESPEAAAYANAGAYGCAVKAAEASSLPFACSAASAIVTNISASIPSDGWLAAWAAPQGSAVAVGLSNGGQILLVESQQPA